MPVFLLSPRGTSGERTEERWALIVPPLPGPLLHPMEEWESLAPHTTGCSPPSDGGEGVEIAV
jgi:hypothetical protein